MSFNNVLASTVEPSSTFIQPSPIVVVKLEHPLNAPLPMNVTLLILIEVKLIQSCKA